MIVGGYLLHLYCDALPANDPIHGFDEFPHQFGHDRETGAQARKDARRKGWRLNLETGRAVCPKCAKLGHRP